MRADRLLSILMLLQSRGLVTAHQLAVELEVSERTIYRDITALSTSGVPVYGTSGPEGGYALVESYRTSLTGLTPGEVRALFALSIPAPLDELGLSNELKAALRKLSASLPDSRRSDELRVRQRIHLDLTGWHHADEGAPHLQSLYQAVWQDRQVSLNYRPLPMLETDLTVEPYALVAKAGIWYLISRHSAQFHVHRLSEILDVHILEESLTAAKILTSLVSGSNGALTWKTCARTFPSGCVLLPVSSNGCPCSSAGASMSGSPRHSRPIPRDGSSWRFPLNPWRPPVSVC